MQIENEILDLYSALRINVHWSWMVKHLILMVRICRFALKIQLVEEEVQMAFSFKSYGWSGSSPDGFFHSHTRLSLKLGPLFIVLVLLPRTSSLPVRSTMWIRFWLRFYPISFVRCHCRRNDRNKMICWREMDFLLCFYCPQNVLIPSRPGLFLYIILLWTSKTSILHINIKKIPIITPWAPL